MEDRDFYWLVAFSLLLPIINLIYWFIVASLRDKPLGSQTIYDQALQGSVLAISYSSGHCATSLIELAALLNMSN